MCVQGLLKSNPHDASKSVSARLLPSIHEIEDVSLTNTLNGDLISSNELWRDDGCVILAFRRPGCGE